MTDEQRAVLRSLVEEYDRDTEPVMVAVMVEKGMLVALLDDADALCEAQEREADIRAKARLAKRVASTADGDYEAICAVLLTVVDAVLAVSPPADEADS